MWWYTDGTSENGTRIFTHYFCVVFFPYYSLAAKTKDLEGADPENFCSFNLALYNQDKKIWTMTEFSKKHINRKNDCFEVANSKIEWKNNRIEIEIDEIATPFPKRLMEKLRYQLTNFSVQYMAR